MSLISFPLFLPVRSPRPFLCYSTVRNDFVSRPLTKGILDGTLLEAFTKLPRARMEELASTVPDLKGGADQILRDIASLRGHWGML